MLRSIYPLASFLAVFEAVFETYFVTDLFRWLGFVVGIHVLLRRHDIIVAIAFKTVRFLTLGVLIAATRLYILKSNLVCYFKSGSFNISD